MTRDRDDDEKARIERAARIHAQIDDLIKGGGQKTTASAPAVEAPKSPRDFIHKRMADLAKGRKNR